MPTVGDMAMFQSNIARFTSLGTRAAIITNELRAPTPGVNQAEFVRNVGALDWRAPLGLRSDRFKKESIDAFNREGARRATGEARAARNLGGSGARGGSSTGRGQSLLMSMLGLLGAPNTTTNQLGGGA